MTELLKRVLCVLMTLTVVFSFSACRHSPVLEQTIYTADGEVDPNNQQTDNDEEHTDENTTLPPKTTQQTASRQNSQTKISAKPKPTTVNPNNPQTKSNSQTRQSQTNAKPSNEDNSNKAQGATPGVNDNPDSPNKAVDRKAVKAEDIPENVANVAAVGPAALFVEMLGGSNRLLAADANTVQRIREGLGAVAFSDAANIQGLWEYDGESAMTDAQFQALLNANPEAVFYVADANYGTVQSFSDAQLTTLNQKGIYTIPLSMFNTTHNIQNNVRMIGKVLGKRNDISGAKDANDMAEKYLKWMDGITSGFGHTFSGPEKLNLDQDTSFYSSDAETVGSYADDGQYTIFIEGWDTGVSTVNDNGVAYTRTGYSKRNSPVSFYLSLGGACNTPILVTDDSSGISYFPVVPTYNELYGGSIRGARRQSAETFRSKSRQITNMGGQYIGDANFKKILVDSASTYNSIITSNAWVNYGLNINNDGVSDYGMINSNGQFIKSNIHDDYEIVINPYGIGSWTQGTPESPLEALWANELFNNNASSDDAFNAIAGEIQDFYAEFFGYQLSADDLKYIKAGGP